jgi:hypothetical protein
MSDWWTVPSPLPPQLHSPLRPMSCSIDKLWGDCSDQWHHNKDHTPCIGNPHGQNLDHSSVALGWCAAEQSQAGSKALMLQGDCRGAHKRTNRQTQTRMQNSYLSRHDTSIRTTGLISTVSLSVHTQCTMRTLFFSSITPNGTPDLICA